MASPIKPGRKIFALAKSILVGVMAVMISPALAQLHPPLDVSAQIAATKSDYVSARVVMVNPSIVFAARLTEKRLKERKCHFVVGQGDALSELINVLSGGAIMEAIPPWEKFEIDPRIGVFLYSQSGAETKLLFEGSFWTDRIIFGMYNSDTTVQASNPSLSRQLRKWASSLPSNPSSQCDFELKRATSRK